MTGSRATGIACLAGTKAVSSRHRRSPLVLCSTTHRGSSRDSLILVVGGRHRKGSAIPAVPHLVQLQSPTYQWVLTGLPGSTLLALGALREGPTFTALSVFLSRGPRVRISLPPPRSLSRQVKFAAAGGKGSFRSSVRVNRDVRGTALTTVLLGAATARWQTRQPLLEWLGRNRTKELPWHSSPARQQNSTPSNGAASDRRGVAAS